MPQPKIRHLEALDMYRAGATDGQIAERFGVITCSAQQWRKRHGLPAKYSGAMAPAAVRKACKLLRDGASKKQVAEVVGVHPSTIQCLRRKLSAEGLRTPGQTRRSIRRKVLEDETLYPRILRAVGTGLPRDVRHDAANELYADVLEGKLAIDLIEDRASRYRTWAWNMCGSPYGPRSLDAANDDELSLGDMIEDKTALKAMEDAAERAWGMGTMLG